MFHCQCDSRRVFPNVFALLKGLDNKNRSVTNQPQIYCSESIVILIARISECSDSSILGTSHWDVSLQDRVWKLWLTIWQSRSLYWMLNTPFNEPKYRIGMNRSNTKLCYWLESIWCQGKGISNYKCVVIPNTATPRHLSTCFWFHIVRHFGLHDPFPVE